MSLLPILCDCGHGEILAELDPAGRKLVIRRIRHGEPHFCVVDIDRLAEMAENKSGQPEAARTAR